jgi:Ca2+-binding RTX toxin-like protein
MTIIIRQFVGGDFGADIFDAALLNPNNASDLIERETTPTRLVVDNPVSELRTVATGTGFTYGPDGPTGGTLEALSFFQGFSETTRLGVAAGLGFDLAAFVAALDAEDAGDSGPLDALFDTRPFDYDAATATRNLSGGFFDGVVIGGSSAADTLRGSAFNDVFESSAGADQFDGRGGFDAVDYGDCCDVGPRGILANLGAGTVIDTFGQRDTLVSIEQVRGTARSDTFIGGNAELNVFGAEGGDTFRTGLGGGLLRPGPGDDTIVGGAGFDEIDYGEATERLIVNLRDGVVLDGLAGTDSVSGVEGARGSSFADIFVGGTAAESFVGRSGADTINGGAGFDTVRYDRDGGSRGVVANLELGTATDTHGFTDTLISIESAAGTAFADTLVGGEGDNLFRGGAGADVIAARGGFDTLDYSGEGGGGRVVVNLTTGQAIDSFGARDAFSSIEEVRATALGDILVGGAADERFRPGAGDDTIDGRAGFDTLVYRFDAGSRGVVVNLATGRAVDAFGARDELSGIEAVEGTARGDLFVGADDAFSDFFGFGGDDRFVGGTGGMFARGGSGVDTVEGGDGYDIAAFDDSDGSRGAVANLSTGVAFDAFGNRETLSAVEELRGGDLADIFVGDSLDNAFVGRAGNDTLNGGAGSDTVRYDRDGGAGGVVVNLGAGTATDSHGATDRLISIENARGTEFADTLVGGAGDNVFRGGDGADVIAARGGVDMLDYSGETGGGRIIVNLTTGQAIDSFGARDVFSDVEDVRGGALNDIFVGGAGDNRFQSGGGADSFDGRGGRDTVDFRFDDASRGVVVNLGTGRYVGADGARGTIVNIERIDGTALADVFVAGAAGGSFRGGAGADTYTGGAGIDVARFNDEGATRNVVVNLATGQAVDGFGDRDTLNSIETVLGGSLGDLLVGGAAGETFIGAGGVDDIRGGGGIDTVDHSFDAELGGTGRVIVNLRDGAALDGFGATDRLSSIEAAIGSTGADIFVGGSGNETFDGRAGADTINGGGGFDFVDYGDDPGRVIVNLGAGTAIDGAGARDTITAVEGVRGSAQNDLLIGSALVNRLEGGAGSDTLRGGAGDDVLLGGAGADFFQITGAGWGEDVVLDFADGVDRIAISGIPGVDEAADFTITQAGAATRIALGGDAILLAGVDAGDITDADFLF